MQGIVRSHGLAAPTESAAVASIARVLGDDAARSLWRRLRVKAGLGEKAPLSMDELLAVAHELSRSDGFAGVMGTALRIRIQTFQMLDRSESSSDGHNTQTEEA
jgi:hypothetical protein